MPLAADAVELTMESPDSVDALACVAAYFHEIGARIEGGFDPGVGPSPSPAEMMPPHGAFFVARLAGAPVGCGGLKTLEPGIGEVKRVWTSPKARGRGVSRAIMAALEGQARAMGLRAVRLDTNKALTEARAFYVGLGYRSVARYNDNPYADYWFEKDL